MCLLLFGAGQFLFFGGIRHPMDSDLAILSLAGLVLAGVVATAWILRAPVAGGVAMCVLGTSWWLLAPANPRGAEPGLSIGLPYIASGMLALAHGLLRRSTRP